MLAEAKSINWKKTEEIERGKGLPKTLVFQTNLTSSKLIMTLETLPFGRLYINKNIDKFNLFDDGNY